MNSKSIIAIFIGALVTGCASNSSYIRDSVSKMSVEEKSEFYKKNYVHISPDGYFIGAEKQTRGALVQHFEKNGAFRISSGASVRWIMLTAGTALVTYGLSRPNAFVRSNSSSYFDVTGSTVLIGLPLIGASIPWGTETYVRRFNWFLCEEAESPECRQELESNQ